ncbi:MAG: ADP-ribosylglycohydrolase family protein [Pontiellaceae bacterium]|nr:ADP-ribosylglycohydrolase family protein [Pontiellaceae bacterium]MBN2783726.1 ADP-ribosylglycohydrolase family protein [Pontiellaceae bacterium]
MKQGLFFIWAAVCSVAIPSFAGDPGSISKDAYYDKTLAMLVGQCGGVVTGYEYIKVRNPDGSFREPHEMWLGLPDEWFSILNGTLGGTTRDEYNYFSNYRDGIIFSDDDQHVDFMNQVILNTYGPGVAYEDIKHSWIHYDLMDFGATDDALKLMKHKDLIAPQMGQREHGNNGHWLPEGYIQHETMGCAFPGMPFAAARMASRFSRMSCEGEPVEWGMYWAAATSIAYFESDIRTVLEQALEVLPGNSYVRETYTICLQLHAKYPDDWRAAVREFWHGHARYVFAVGTEKRFLVANVNNANCILSALYGENDYMETLRIQSLSGGDAECGASTLCGILGVIHGMAGTPAEFVEHVYKDGEGIWRNDMDHALHMNANFQQDWSFPELARLIQENAENEIRFYGGRVANGQYRIYDTSFLPQRIAFNNWDFEQGSLDGWTVWNLAGSRNSAWAELQWQNEARNATLAATGYYKATLITSDDKAECRIYQTINGLKPGATYKIEGRINAPGGREARMYADHYGGPYTYVSMQGGSIFPFRYLYVTLGPDRTSMEVGFHAPPTTNPAKWCSFDDLVITEVPTMKGRVYAIKDAVEIAGYEDGEHLLRLYYANSGTPALFRVTVNGRSIGNVELGDTGTWSVGSANHADIYARLKKGRNRILLEPLEGQAALQKIEVYAARKIR